MDKRGFLRIVEASIAIVIIIGVLFVFFNRQQVISSELDLSEKARDILEEVSKDTALRDAVLNNDTVIIDAFISSKIVENYLVYEFRLCDIGVTCGKLTFTEGDVFSAERSISSTITNLGPRKIRLFIWARET